MLLIPILLISGAIGYIVFIFLNKDKKVIARKNEQQYEAKAAVRVLLKRKEQLDTIEEELFGIINAQFGTAISDNIKEGGVFIGMPTELLMISWGKPLNIVKDSGDEKKEKWYYGYDSESMNSEQTEVIIENNKIHSWKEF